MAFLDKLKETARTIGDKTGDVIESTKLHARMNKEKGSIKDEMEEIGKLVYERFTNGEIYPAFLELCESIKIHYENIQALEAEIEMIKNEDEIVEEVVEEEIVSE